MTIQQSSNLKYISFQDVFEVKFAKMPDEPFSAADDDDDDETEEEMMITSKPAGRGEPNRTTVVGGATPGGSSSESEDEEVEREKRLKQLQAQVSSWNKCCYALNYLHDIMLKLQITAMIADMNY